MLTVTESAKGLLKEILSAQSDDPEICVRLTLKAPGQLGLMLGKEETGDQVIEHEGTKILLVTSELAPVFEEATMDVDNTEDGPKLVVRDNRAEN